MFNKAKYWVGKIAGILAILLGLSFLGNLFWLLGIQGTTIRSGGVLMRCILNLLLVATLAITCVICGMGLLAKPRYCGDDSAHPLWIFVSNAKVIVLIAFCAIICLTDAIDYPLGNIVAWLKRPPTVIRFNDYFTLYIEYPTIDKPQMVIKWLQVALSAISLVLSAVFLFLRPMVAAKDTEGLDEEVTESLDEEIDE